MSRSRRRITTIRMRVFRGIESLPPLRNAVATMGSFDGVHSGHRVLLERVKQRAKELDGESVVLTFDPHPRYTLGTAEGMQLLSTLEEKIWLLEQAEIDNLIIIPFTLEFSRTSPMDFIQSLTGLGIRSMVVGYNHRFGHKKEGDYNYLSSHGAGMEIAMVEQQQVANGKVSSTIVREAIEAGEMERVAQMLSRPYIIIGNCNDKGLITGLEQEKMLPPAGSYRAKVEGEECQITIGKDRCLRLGGAAREGKVLVELI